MRYQTVKGCFFAIVSAVIFGCMPLMAKNIYKNGVNPMTLVFLRNLFSLLPLGMLAYREQKTLKAPLSVIPSIGLISFLGCSITPILLFSSYQHIASGLATVIHFAYPSFVILAEILFLRKKVRASSLISLLLCIAGISMFYTPAQAFSFTGAVLALLSGVTFAGYVVLLSLFDSSRLSGFLFSFYTTLASAIITLCICIPANQLALPTTLSGWGLCILFSLLVTTCALVLFQRSIFLIGGPGASILSTLEPITSVFIGIVIFQEPLGIRILIGTALVIAASVITVFFTILKKGREE